MVLFLKALIQPIESDKELMMRGCVWNHWESESELTLQESGSGFAERFSKVHSI